jgi:GntR family transcriptional regulator, vanillate catabolism transcriptional regulator
MDKPGQRVLTALRKMIGSGELVAGERLAEIPTAERLGVSRMPVRMAFRALEQEGLLVKAGARGYEVRAVSPADIVGAVEVRGVLEGLAARLAAEKGLAETACATLKSCLDAGDELMARGMLADDDAFSYHEMNVLFHQTVIEASGNPAIVGALSKNDRLPFGSVRALTIDFNILDREYWRLRYAHMQHHAIFEALCARQGARAESLMREHASAATTDLL